EESSDELVSSSALSPHLGETISGKALPVAKVEGYPLHVVQVPECVALEVRADRLDGSDVELSDLALDLGRLLGRLAEDPEQQVFLRLDVVIEASLENAHLVCNVLDRCRAEALVPEDLDRGSDDFGVAVVAPLRGFRR